MDLSIIIINFNTDNLTLQAIHSVKRFYLDIKYEIIVIDNGSNKTNLTKLLKKYDNIYLYKLKKNIGFGKANNYAFSNSKGKYIFLFNSDAYLIERNTLSIMKEYLRLNNKVGIVGANLLTSNLTPNISYGNFLKPERVLYNYGLKSVSEKYFKENLATAKFCDFKKTTEVDYLTGAAIMIKRELIEKYGLFDPKYFMYLEDMDLAYKYKYFSYKSVILPDAKIVHIGGQSRKGNKKISKKIYKEIEYSKFLFVKKSTNIFIVTIFYFLGKFIDFEKRVIKKTIKVFKYENSSLF